MRAEALVLALAFGACRSTQSTPRPDGGAEPSHDAAVLDADARMADAEAADATADARAPATRERPTSLAETLSDGERRKLAACMAQTWCGTLGYFGTFTTHVGIDDSGRDRRVAYYGTGESGCYRAPTIGTPCLRAVADELVAEREWLAGSTFGLVVTGPYAQWRFRDERDLAWLDKARTR